MGDICGTFKQQTSGFEQFAKDLRDSFARHAVAAAKHPHQFEHYLARNETWFLRSQTIEESTRLRLLSRIVAG